MAEHERTGNHKQENAERKHRNSTKNPEFPDKQIHAWDTDNSMLAETPFVPRMSEHTNLLTASRNDDSRINLLTQLQRTYGNNYVQRLIISSKVQRKMTVNAPNDKYEQEADRVADKVSTTLATQPQRQEEEEEELLQAKPLQRQEEEEEELLQAKPIQRQEEEEEELQAKLVQRASATAVPKVTSDAESRINSAKNGGEPLHTDIRANMENAIGSDFGGVKIHRDSTANSLNQELQARAFTTGQDIFFRTGEYNPQTAEGQKLIAHELTHTIQQTGKKQLKRDSKSISRKTAPPIPKSKPWKKQPPPVPTSKPWKQEEEGNVTEQYGSKPLEGMDRVTYDQAVEQFEIWKKPRIRGGLSKSKRKSEAEKYLAEKAKAAKSTPYSAMIINSILSAYKDTFGEELSRLDMMKGMQQMGGGATPEEIKQSMQGFGKESRKEENVGVTKEAIGTGFSWGKDTSSTTQTIIDESVPLDKEGKSYSKSDKGKKPMGIAGGATDIFGALGSGITGIFGIVKTAQLVKKKQGSKAFVSILGNISSVVGTLTKGAKGVLGVVKSAVNAGKGSALDVAKTVLGPIPDAVNTIVGIIKIAYAAFQKKSKEALANAWETVKSGIGAITSTISTVFSLISTLGGAVPIVGAVATGISAILNGIEAGYKLVKKIFRFLSMKKLIAQILEKIKEIKARQAKDETEKKENKEKKDRLIYIGKNNLKKIKAIGREVLKQGTALLGNIVKLAGGIASLVGEIVAMTVVASPVGAVFKAFGTVAGIFSTVVAAIAGAITFVPKLFHSIRQAGRNLAAKEGKTGKFFKALGFNANKSTDKKEAERQKVVVGIFDHAAKLKTDFDDPSGKDKEKVQAEIPKFKDLEFEIEATGADKNELYKHNEETDDEKRAKSQVKVIYDALKERG